MNNLEAVTDLVKCLAEPLTIVRGVQTSETEEGMLSLPDSRSPFLNPMPGHGKIAVSIQGLPCITSEADFTDGFLALNWSHILVPLHQQGTDQLTFKRLLSTFIWSLNVLMISFCVCLPLGMPAIFVVRAAILNIFLKAGCSNTWTG